MLINTAPFLALPVAVQRRMLRRGIECVRGSLRIDRLPPHRRDSRIDGKTGGERQNSAARSRRLPLLRSARLAPIGFDSRIERDFELPLQIPGINQRYSPRHHNRGGTTDHRPVYNGEVNGLDWERCAGPLFLRNWRPGDQFKPMGRPGSEKIKTLFQEFRIPLWERRRWPVIA